MFGGRRRGCCLGKCAQMLAFGLVELQRIGDTLEHLFGGAGEVAALHADVVVDAHAGERQAAWNANCAEPTPPPARPRWSPGPVAEARSRQTRQSFTRIG